MDSSSIEELTSVVSAKFVDGEKIIALLDNAALVGLEENWNRILTIVKCGNEYALFVLISVRLPPVSFSDLLIDSVFPIDNNFKSEFDDIGDKFETSIYFSITTVKLKLQFKLSPGNTTACFLDILHRCIESVSGIGNQSFIWLQKYSGSNKSTDFSSTFDMHTPDVFISREDIAHGSSSFTKREKVIKYHMQLKEQEYIYIQPFNIFIGTWNVNGQPPLKSLKRWLCNSPVPPDIYAVGFQELDLSKEAFLFDFTPREAEWYDAVVQSLDERAEYIKVRVIRLIGMMLIVLVKREHCHSIEDVASDTVGTGIMGKMGNKGGVSIRFKFHNTTMCFVNSHLAAHVEEYERRNQDFQEICNRTQFQLGSDNLIKRIKDHNQIYWLGDLNYRITDMDYNTVKDLLKKNELDLVLKVDQLKIQHSNSNVLSGFIEGPITFQPTYKYDPGTDMWDSSEKERAPAWCDRVFWRGESIKQLTYKSHPELNISDHKPVSATFISEVKVIDKKKHAKVHEDVIKKLDKLENEFLPHVTVEPTEIFFDKVKYLEPQSQEICIANTGQVPVRFEFIKKLEESSYCKDWLNIEPNVHTMNPGEKCDVKLIVLVNKKSAFKLNLGEDKLYDILVLHLDGGKDIFLTVNGTYEKSCFGSSIETLIHIKAPVHEVLVKKMCDVNLQDGGDSMYYRKVGYSIPKEIWYLVDHIYKYGLKQPNLFKQSGINSELLMIREWLDHGCSTRVPGNIHSVVNALILFLESTVEPIIPYNHHSHGLNVSNNYLQCKQIVMQLPEHKRNVYLYLCYFLQEVLNYSGENGTDIKSLSFLFGTIFLRDPPQNKTRNTEAKKKALFVEHFLVHDLSDVFAK